MPKGVYVGRGRHYRGGVATGHFGLVAYVPMKLPLDELTEAARIPRFLEGRHAGQPYRLPIDVKPIPHAVKHASIAPGRATVGTSTRHGLLSGAIATATGYVVLLSGHVARAVGTRIYIRALDGSVMEIGAVASVRDDATMDAAIVRDVAAAELIGLLLDPVAVRSVSENLDTEAVSVAASNGVCAAHVDDVGHPVTFDTGTMSRLIALLPRVTDGGDSGAPVTDAGGALIGFIVGADNDRSYAISAMEVLNAML